MKRLMTQLRAAAFNFWPEYLVFLVGTFYTPLAHMGLGQFMTITAMLLAQNATFTLVSRARQSNNLLLHGVFAIGSNGFFIFVITAFAANYNNFYLKLWYIACTVVGSVHAHHISLTKIEKSKMFAKDTMVSKNDLAALRDLLTSTMSTTVSQLKGELMAVIREEVENLRSSFALKELRADRPTSLILATPVRRAPAYHQQRFPERSPYPRRRTKFEGQQKLAFEG